MTLYHKLPISERSKPHGSCNLSGATGADHLIGRSGARGLSASARLSWRMDALREGYL